MSVVLRYKGDRFLFFSNEGNPREPIHVHDRKVEATAKFWIEPEVTLESSYKLKSSELTELEQVVRQNRELIVRAWHEHFGE